MEIDRRDNSALLLRLDMLADELVRLETRLTDIEMAVARSRGFIGGVVASFSVMTGVVTWTVEHFWGRG